MPLPIDPALCGPGTVPGWLNEDGLPTSCVGDDPMPGLPSPLPTFTAEPAPVPQPPVVDEPEVNPEPLPPALPLDPLPETQTVTEQQWSDHGALAETGPLENVMGVLVVAAMLIVVGWLTWATNARDKYKR